MLHRFYPQSVILVIKMVVCCFYTEHFPVSLEMPELSHLLTIHGIGDKQWHLPSLFFFIDVSYET